MLKPVPLFYEDQVIPDEIRELLRDVDQLVEQHRVNTATHFRGFVPSDYAAIYQCLQCLYDSSLLAGTRFCEWGSGLGVVATLASLIGFESIGIEYDEELCALADDIAADHDAPVQLVCGSFLPNGIEDLIDAEYAQQDGQLSLHLDADRTYDELGYDICDFDLIFAFPWPNDIELTRKIFERSAAPGALLLTYYSTESIGLDRKL